MAHTSLLSTDLVADPAGQVPPNEGSYRYVLRRYDRDPRIRIPCNTYDENTFSLDISLSHERACTLFLSSEPARDRMLKLGWFDETEIWNARPKWADPWNPENPLSMLDEVERSVLTALLLAGEWLDVAEVCARTGCALGEVQDYARKQNRIKEGRLVAQMGPRLVATEAAKSLVAGV